MVLIDVVMVIGVIGWFARIVKIKGLNKYLWGFIGGISFYGPACSLLVWFIRRS